MTLVSDGSWLRIPQFELSVSWGIRICFRRSWKIWNWTFEKGMVWHPSVVWLFDLDFFRERCIRPISNAPRGMDSDSEVRTSRESKCPKLWELRFWCGCWVNSKNWCGWTWLLVKQMRHFSDDYLLCHLLHTIGWLRAQIMEIECAEPASWASWGPEWTKEEDLLLVVICYRHL